MLHPFSLFPLGDSALTVEFGGEMSEETSSKVYLFWHKLMLANLKGILDIVPGYTTLTIHFDPLHPVDPNILLGQDFQDFSDGQDFTSQDRSYFSASPHSKRRSNLPDEDSGHLETPLPLAPSGSGIIEIPVCYSPRFAPDLPALSKVTGLSVNEIIHLHTTRSYRVYMLGFLPGFAYMGEVDARIAIGRKPAPTPVLAGSVGIAGKQTGIYPCNSPGGWQIIGRTPVSLFHPDRKPLTLLFPGDSVKFVSITEDEFENH